MRERLVELVRFGFVGGLAFVVDVGLFNLLRFGPGDVLDHKPLTAKVISVAVATVVAWLGNRYWAFAARRTASRAREFLAFAIANVVGMAIAVGCLAVSHYVLGLRSALADNIAANVVGLALGTVFRYLAYRFFVFTGATGRPADARDDALRSIEAVSDDAVSDDEVSDDEVSDDAVSTPLAPSSAPGAPAATTPLR